MRFAAFVLASLVCAAGVHAQTFTTLHSFAGSDGSKPYAGLIGDSDGNLFGTTTFGGASDVGTVFRIGSDGNGFTTLHSFTNSGPVDPGAGSFGALDGRFPRGGLLLDRDGNLFGTTSAGGADGRGTMFTIRTDGIGYSPIYFFSGLDGSSPYAGLVGNPAFRVFGTTTFGGESNNGTIFVRTPESPGSASRTTVLHSFSGPDGAQPSAGLLSDGFGGLFGTTASGGDSNNGTIFRIGSNGSGFTTLHSFSGPDGGGPNGELIDYDGFLFGTTEWGGLYDRGTIFTIREDGNFFITVHNFSGPDGDSPSGSILIDANRNIFGTTRFGGAYGLGSIFRVNAENGDFVTLHSFSGPDGSEPIAGLFVDANGDLFGTTYAGGARGLGTIFQLKGAGFAFAFDVIPEPGTWAMMIAGFGLVGAGLRMRRREMALDDSTANTI